MDLEQLAKALREMKNELLTYAVDEAAPVANKELVAVLSERAAWQAAGKPGKPVPEIKHVANRMNQQQQKFLKQAPVMEQAPAVAIQASKQNNGYVITGPKLTVTDADVTNYRNTISEQIKKSLDNL